VFDENDEELKTIAEGFLSYANQFIPLYVKTATEYLRNHKKIPDYKVMLELCFCKYMKHYTENYYLKNLEFSEEQCKEAFEEIQEQLKEKGIELEASDNIQESFIKLCREKYPLAKKNLDFIFTNKKFKNEFLDELLKLLDRELENHYSDVIRDCMEDIREKFNDLSEEDLKRNFAFNIPINIARRINDMHED
jgi:hypothetical protein